MNKKIIGLISLFALMGMVLAPVVVHALTINEILDQVEQGMITWEKGQELLRQISGNGTDGTGGTGDTGGGTDGTGLIGITTEGPPAYSAGDVMNILPRIVNFAFGFLIALVVLMIIIAAYMFITAGGSSDRITSARKFLMFALIGLAVGVLSQGLVRLVQLIIGTPGGGGASVTF